ncbi:MULTISPECIES: hypothetical protein [unclassified Corynebacterium]|uniref:hypothetical protein n=1 Tax=unclassified Corynebacterium TaxID=2624378 RepID=UPI0029C9BB0A|nr:MULTISPECIES: hypothetical protein [unclassified Corynebacterium]WPF66438.1 hypothetical protein OLX12_01540 [Corynebacterium sp. 22KM0430]WPF68928.1 hypothetical protein OLW90_01540 [Corynebacterium sp. 21KM1197]
MDDNETRYLGPTGNRGEQGNQGRPTPRPRQHFPEQQHSEEQYSTQQYQNYADGYPPEYADNFQDASPEPEADKGSKGGSAMAIAGVIAAILISAGVFFFLGRAAGEGQVQREVVTETQVSTVTVTETVTEDSGLRLPELPSEIPSIPEVQMPSWLQDLLGGTEQTDTEQGTGQGAEQGVDQEVPQYQEPQL